MHNHQPVRHDSRKEHGPSFKKLKNKHNAIESNISDLEYCGLYRCQDWSLPHFTWYVGLAVCAYNLKKMGRQILKREREALNTTALEVRTAAKKHFVYYSTKISLEREAMPKKSKIVKKIRKCLS